jgi:hypothetical protein
LPPAITSLTFSGTTLSGAKAPVTGSMKPVPLPTLVCARCRSRSCANARLTWAMLGAAGLVPAFAPATLGEEARAWVRPPAGSG